jgi:hypothetical protein
MVKLIGLNITKDDITDGISATGGTNGYVARWTPDGTTLGNSLIQDNGTSLSIGNAPNNISILDIDTTLQGPFITITKINTAGNQSAYGMTASSSGINSLGDNIGVAGFANGNSNRAIGVVGNAVNNVGNVNIGGYFTAANGVSNYSVQLSDGSQTSGGGKFLKDTGDGKANWAQITKDDITDGISATGGTNNYITKWTPDGTTLGNSLLRDDGTSLSIGIAPVSTRRLLSYSNTHQQSIYGLNQTTTGAGTGVYGKSDGATIGSQNYGVQGYAGGATGASSHNIGVLGSGGSSIALPAFTDGVHIGVWGNATANSTNAIGLAAYSRTSNSSDNIGIYVNVHNAGAGNAYIGRFIDGNQGLGKFLTSDVNGYANWSNIQISDISGLTNDWSSQTGALVDTNTTISHTTLNTNTNSIIGGGQNNKLDNSDNAVIIGGINNNILSGNTSFIIGGSNNDIQARSGSDLGQSGVLGGSNNNIIDVSSDSDRSFIIGGVNNDINNSGDSIILSSGLSDITSSSSSSIVGSSSSLVTNSSFSSIIGGFNNELIGTTRSVVLGGQNITGTTDDTVYVPNLNIQNVPTGTTVTSLGVDTNGNVIKSNSPSSVAFSPINVGICDTAPTAALHNTIIKRWLRLL